MNKYTLYKAHIDDIDLNKVKIRSHPGMNRWERETIININDGETEAKITTWQVVWTKHLMHHPYFSAEKLWMHDEYTVVGIDGIIPKTCIRTSARPRQRFDKI